MDSAVPLHPPALPGFSLLRKAAGGGTLRGGDANLSFENASRLVTIGPCRLIRHPMVASLLLLT